MGAAFGLGHVEFGAAGDHLLAVFNEILDKVFQVEEHGTAMHQGDVVDGKRALQFAELEEFVEDDVGDDVVTQHVHHSGAFFVGLIADVGDADNLAILDQLGLALDHLALVDAIRYGVCHDDVATLVVHIDGGVGTEHNAAAAGVVSVAHTVIAIDGAAAGEVGSLDVLHKLVDGDVVVVNVCYTAIEDFAQVMGGHIGGHTYGDAVGAVDQEVGHPRREDGGLFALVGIGGHHVDGVLLYVGHHLVGYLLHAALGVTHGRRAVAVNAAEVTLTVDHGVAHIPRLRHTNHGKVHRRVAMGMVLTQHLADHGGRFTISGVIEHTHVVHGKKYSALHRLEAISDIGQRARHDDRHGIVDIGGLHGSFDVYARDFFVFRNHLLLILLCFKCKMPLYFYN